MTPRYRRARELAGLSLGQAAKLLDVDLVWLSSVELEQIQPDLDWQRRMAEVYGCSLAWLQGNDPEIPESTRKMLRESDLSPTERDALLELVGSIWTRR